MVHDGTTACQRIKKLRTSNTMLPMGEKVVWRMPTDGRRRNKLESAHQYVLQVLCRERENSWS